VDRLPSVCRPEIDGGVLARAGTVEVVSSLERDGRPVERDLRWGVYVTIQAPTEYVRRCFAEYGLAADETGYAAMYRPFHLVGLELTLSVLRAGRALYPSGWRTVSPWSGRCGPVPSCTGTTSAWTRTTRPFACAGRWNRAR
jgi:predicted homoserine dehydrogenase-like protein